MLTHFIARREIVSISFYPLRRYFFRALSPPMTNPAQCPVIQKPRVTDLIRIGVSPGYASEILAGKKTPSLAMAKRIAAATGWPVDAWATKDDVRSDVQS